ncbi:MAG: hypothetical protein ACHRXM_26345 [Isosphaerales bacterium]
MTPEERERAAIRAAFPSYREWRGDRLAQAWTYGAKEGDYSDILTSDFPEKELRAEYDAELADALARAAAGGNGVLSLVRMDEKEEEGN